MRFLLFLSCVFPGAVIAQSMDSRETLEWVKRRADKLEVLLNGAALSYEPNHLNLQLWNAWQEFDAIAQMGLQCAPVQLAAEKGRTESDVLGYRREHDLNALIMRAVEARRQALLMRNSADYCLQQPGADAQGADLFAPRRVLRKDAEIAALDLSDALATDDRDIRNQKVEHALYLLRNAEYLAATLEDCRDVRGFANRAIAACSLALLADTTAEFEQRLQEAIEWNDKINQCERCR